MAALSNPMLSSGLLGLGMGMLKASGPSTVPTSFGQAMGSGLEGMDMMMQQQVDNELAKGAHDMRRQEFEARQQAAEEERQAAAQQQRQFEALLATMPPEQARMLRMFGPKEAVLDRIMPKPAEPTSYQRDLIAAGFQPGTPAFQQKLLEMRMKPASSVNVQLPTYEKEYDKAIGKSYADRFIALQDQGQKAEGRLATLGSLAAALGDEAVYTGTAGPTISALKRAGGTLFGIEDIEGIGSAELAETVGNQLALEMKDMLPGPMSDSDRRFLQSLPPGLSKSREGNMLITDFYRRTAERQRDIADMARDYQARHGRLDPGFDREVAALNQQNPVFDATDFAAMQEAAGSAEQPSPLAGIPAAAIDFLRSNPETAEQFNAKFGPGAAQQVLGR